MGAPGDGLRWKVGVRNGTPKRTKTAPKHPFFCQKPCQIALQPPPNRFPRCLHAIRVLRDPFYPAHGPVGTRLGPFGAFFGHLGAVAAIGGPKPKIGRISGLAAQNRIPRALFPRGTPHFWWFPPLGMAPTDTQTPKLASTAQTGRPGTGGPGTGGCKGPKPKIGRISGLVARKRNPRALFPCGTPHFW